MIDSRRRWRLRRGALGALATLVIALRAPLAAADQPPRAERFSFRRLGTADGLPGDSVYCMLQDGSGYLWLGTFSGLARYDGSRIVVYRPVPGDPESLPSSLVFDIHEDSSGTLWIATDGGGLARYSRDSDAFKRFTHDADQANSLASDRIFAVADDTYGWIWVGTADAGLDRLDVVNGTFAHYGAASGLPSDTVRALLCDGDGGLWVGTTAGLARYDRDGDAFTAVASIGTVTVRALASDDDGAVLVGTEGKGAFRLDASSLGASPLMLGTGSGRLLVRALAKDDYGRIWAGLDDGGLRILDPGSGALASVRTDAESPGGLSHDAVRSLLVDRSGLVWVGTRGGGAAAYNPRSKAIARLAPEGGLPPFEIRQILEASDGALWVCTDGGGLVRASARGEINVFAHDESDAASIPGDRVICVAEDRDGRVWVGTDGAGLARLDPSTGGFERFARNPATEDSLGGDTVWALLVDETGVLWVGLEGGGLDRFDDETGGFAHHRPIHGDEGSLSGNSVRALLQDSRGRMWVGLWDGGLTLWDPAAGKAIARFKPSSDADSLADASITCLLEDGSGRIWAGTGGSGIDRVVEVGGDIRFAHLSMADGLAGNDIVGALEDGRGDIWMVSGRGVSRLEPASGEIRSWGPADGFQERFSQNAWAVASDGRILLGGPAGIDSFRPGDLEHPAAPPPVVIADVSIVAHPESDAALRSRRTRAFRAALNQGVIVLRPEDAALTLDFAVLDYVDPARNRLSVELWGGPAERMELGSQSRAVLGGLAAGDYELRVGGATAGGVWNREGARLRIIVAPPFWQTSEFIGIGAIAVLLAAFTFVRSRTKTLETRAERMRTLSMHIQDAREEERKTAAREVHDELGQLLTAAKLDLSWLKSHPPAPNAFAERVGEAIVMVDSAIDSVKRISTRLRPKALDTLSLSEALRWQLEDFGRRSDIECRAIIDPAPEEVGEEAATTMFRVLQELLTNVGRHSGATGVDVRFAAEDGCMTLEVRDDGRGLPRSAADSPESLGILGMRERVRHQGGEFYLESPPEGMTTGTKAFVSIPLSRDGTGSRQRE